MLKTVEYSFILRAKTPIAHHVGTDGSTTGMLKASPHALPDGSVREVPDVSGNSMRHGLRESIAIVSLDAMDLLKPGTFENPDAVRLLFNGGSNTGSSNTIKIDDMRAMQSLVPALSLFGGTSSNQIHEGRIEVGSAYLICRETMHELEPWQTEALKDVRIATASEQQITIQHYSRDATDSSMGQYLLSDGAKTELLNRKRKREKATDDGDEMAATESKGGQMPHAAQAVRIGSLWTWSVVAHVFNELEEATLATTVAAFLRRAVVGSGRRVQNGQFVVYAARGFDHMRPAEAAKVLMGADDVLNESQAKLYIDHLKEHSGEILEWLKTHA